MARRVGSILEGLHARLVSCLPKAPVQSICFSLLLVSPEGLVTACVALRSPLAFPHKVSAHTAEGQRPLNETRL